MIKKLVSLLAFVASFSANAGIPVIDAGSIAQAMQQVAAWQQQYQQMTQQIQQLTAQINAVTGARNLGSILNNPNIQTALPQEYRDITRLLNGGQLSAAPAVLKGITDAYGLDLSSSPDAFQNEAQTLADAREKQNSRAEQAQAIKDLADQVNGLADLKESSDMVNRNLIELQRIMLAQIQRTDLAEAKAAADKLREAAASQARIKTLVNSLKMTQIQ